MHASKMSVFDAAVNKKRNASAEPKDESPLKQLRIDEPGMGQRKICQDKMNDLVVDFVVNGAHTFSVVQEPSFVKMLQYLAPTQKVLTRRMLVTKIDEKFLEMKCRLQDTFQHLNYVTVTADCWSSHHRYRLAYSILFRSALVFRLDDFLIRTLSILGTFLELPLFGLNQTVWTERLRPWHAVEWSAASLMTNSH